MRRIEWDAHASSDPRPHDDMRRDMLDILNRLTDSALCRDQVAVLDVVGALRDVAERQFAAEEADMAAARYHAAASHVHRHRRVLSEIDVWRGRVRENWRLGLGSNLFLRMVPVMYRHFSEEDLRFDRHRRLMSSYGRRSMAERRAV